MQKRLSYFWRGNLKRCKTELEPSLAAVVQEDAVQNHSRRRLEAEADVGEANIPVLRGPGARLPPGRKGGSPAPRAAARQQVRSPWTPRLEPASRSTPRAFFAVAAARPEPLLLALLPGHLAESTPGYRPRSASNALKEIVEDSLEDLLRLWDERFLKDHGPLHPRVRDLMEAFVRCGDPHFGFPRLKCVEAECPTKTERIVPFSCKARALCPSRSKKRALLWAERMVEDVLPSMA